MTSRPTRRIPAPARPRSRRCGSTARWPRPGRCWATTTRCTPGTGTRRSDTSAGRWRSIPTTPTRFTGTTEIICWPSAGGTRRSARRGAPASSTRSVSRSTALLGRTLYSAGRAEEALPHLRNVVAMDTTFPLTNEYLGTAYVALGRYAEAVPVLRRASIRRCRRPCRSRSLATRWRRAGRRAEAEAIRHELLERQRRGYVAPTSLAVLSCRPRRHG